MKRKYTIYFYFCVRKRRYFFEIFHYPRILVFLFILFLNLLRACFDLATIRALNTILARFMVERFFFSRKMQQVLAKKEEK